MIILNAYQMFLTLTITFSLYGGNYGTFLKKADKKYGDVEMLPSPPDPGFTDSFPDFGPSPPDPFTTSAKKITTTAKTLNSTRPFTRSTTTKEVQPPDIETTKNPVTNTKSTITSTSTTTTTTTTTEVILPPEIPEVSTKSTSRTTTEDNKPPELPEPVTTISTRPTTTDEPEEPEEPELPTIVTSSVAPRPTTPAKTILNVLFTCSFENDTCGMNLGSTNSIQHYWRTATWYRQIQDRVTERGKFLASTWAARTTGTTRTTRISLRTPILKGTGYPLTLDFFFHAFQSKFDVYLILHNSSLKQSLYTADTNVKNQLGIPWKFMKLVFQVPLGELFDIRFTVNTGLIAIDDINILPAASSTDLPSPSVLSCGFHSKLNKFCAWKLGGDFKWATHRRSTPSLHTGPLNAVTGVRTDRYAYAEASLPQKSGDVAWLESFPVISGTRYCLSFFSNTYGRIGERGTLTLFLVTYVNGEKVYDELKTDSSTLANEWMSHHTDLPVGEKFSLLIRAKVGDGPNGDVAIDNIVSLPGQCPNSTTVIHECGFDKGLSCGNLNMKSAGFRYVKNGNFDKGERVVACEHSRPDGRILSCPVGQRIRIVKAMYGRVSSDICPLPRSRYQTNCLNFRSLYIAKQRCNGKRRCYLRASNRMFGDPCKGIVKYLDVSFECVSATMTVATTPSSSAQDSYATALAKPARRTCVRRRGRRCRRWRNKLLTARLEFIVPNVDRFGACLTFEYRVHAPAINYAVSFNVQGSIGKEVGRSFRVLRRLASQTIKAVPEGGFWQIARYTLPPSSSGGPIKMEITGSMSRRGLKRLDIDNIAIENGAMCESL